MSLAADRLSMELHNPNSINVDAAIDRWQQSAPSTFGHHGQRCCSDARAWLFATDYSQLIGQHKLTGPRWLLRRFKWGPSEWPMTWCRAVEEKTLDCGALAALTRDLFIAREVNCFSAQLILQYTDNITHHWSKKWASLPAPTHWIHGALIYHEVCAVQVTRDEIRVWDPTAACWVNPTQNSGFGSVVALCVRTNNPQAPSVVRWGQHKFQTDQWRVFQSSRPQSVFARPTRVKEGAQFSQ